MIRPPPLAFSHIGIFVHDLEKKQGFYAPVPGGSEIVFPSRDARVGHRIELATG